VARTGRKYIAQPGEIVPAQTTLFADKSTYNPYPVISTVVNDFEKLIEAESLLGIDFEFNTRKDGSYDPTIVAVSSLEKTVGLPWSAYLGRLCLKFIERGGKFVAYSTLGADKPVLEDAMSVKTPLHAWEDGMLVHYLANQSLTKTTAKDVSDDAGALGLMGLYTAASLVSDLPQYKVCRGPGCYQSGEPCPSHSPLLYCAVDAWAGLKVYVEQFKKLKRFGVGYDFYRSKMELGEMCWEMQRTGVKIDRAYVKEFDANSAARKELLFDFTLRPGTVKAKKELERLNVPPDLTPEELREVAAKNPDWSLDEDDFERAYTEFNPNSPAQIIQYFSDNNVTLKTTDKKYLLKTLEKYAYQFGLEKVTDIDEADNIPHWLQNLYNLWCLKSEGKGIKAWFGEQYLDVASVIHPRWLFTGTSSGRLSSSGPNFTNIPARGFGELLRKAVIPHYPGWELYKADKAQVELRKVLHCAGMDQAILGADAFSSLVQQSGEDFFNVAKDYDPALYAKDRKKAARNIAKIFCHANSYLIGIDIIPYNRLDDAKTLKLIDDGLLRVYRKKYVPQLKRDWEYGGGVVAFTGKHLAETAYKADTPENRRKALRVQEDVHFKNFFFIREWQMGVTERIERDGFIQHSCGTFLELFDSSRDSAKIAAGYIGQGETAHYMQELMLNFKRIGETPIMQVHDELVFQQPPGRTDEQVLEFFRPMREPSKLFDGFSVPIEVKRGPNWKDLRTVGLL